MGTDNNTAKDLPEQSSIALPVSAKKGSRPAADLVVAAVEPPVRLRNREGRFANVTLLISEFQARVAGLRANNLSSKAFAREILSMLGELVAIETGISSIEEGAPLFLHSLWESSSHGDLFSDLYRTCLSAVHNRSRTAHLPFSPDRVERDFIEVLRWYATRKVSLYALASEGLDDYSDKLFGFTLIHDKTWFGAKGFEAVCGLKLIGRAGQPLWFKVYVASGENYIPVRVGWEKWTDDLNFFDSGCVDKDRRATSMLPIIPNGQRLIIDNLRVFMPYEALDLPPGRSDIQVEAVLLDQRGIPIVSAYRDEIIFSAALSSNGSATGTASPSPQSLGLWSRDCVSGDVIANPRVIQSYRGSSENALDVVLVSCDLDLFGHIGEEITVEFRVLDERGSLLESNSRSHADNDGYFLHQILLRPQSSVARHYGLTAEILAEELLIETGEHKLNVEISALSAANRLICGTTTPFVLRRTKEQRRRVIDSLAPTTRSLEHDIGYHDIESGLELGAIQVNPAARFNGRDSFRVIVPLRSDFWEYDSYRVMVNLIDSKGMPLQNPEGEEIVRCLWVGGFAVSAQQNLVFNFDYDEILPEDYRDSREPMQLECRIAVFSSEDCLVFERRRESLCQARAAITPRPRSDMPRALIADVVTTSAEAFRKYNCTVRINFNFDCGLGGRFKLYYELLDSNGRVVGGGDGADSIEALDGVIVEVDLSDQINQAIYRRGWFQFPLAFDYDLSCLDRSMRRQATSLRIMLFSPEGTLEHVALHSLRGVTDASFEKLGDSVASFERTAVGPSANNEGSLRGRALRFLKSFGNRANGT